MASTASDFDLRRELMVERQLEDRGISAPAVLDAFRTVPREAFVREDDAVSAYDDCPLAIACGQTISQPYIVALMLQAADLHPADRVLEVGAGSGYAAALISRIAERVVAIERHAELAELARDRLQRLGYRNARIIHGDGSRGCPEEAPFEAILAAATGSHVPEPLVDQLAPGGRIVMPVGDPGSVQKLVKVTKVPAGKLIHEDLGPVRFVPLVGEEGWSDD